MSVQSSAPRWLGHRWSLHLGAGEAWPAEATLGPTVLKHGAEWGGRCACACACAGRGGQRLVGLFHQNVLSPKVIFFSEKFYLKSMFFLS